MVDDEKKKKNKWIVLGSIILLILLGLWVSFYTLMNNPKYVITKSITKTFSVVKQEVKNESLFANDTFSFNVKASFGGDTLSGALDGDVLKLGGYLDRTNKRLSLNGRLIEDDKTLLDGVLTIKDDEKYVSSANLFDNIYSLKNYACNDDSIICDFLKADFFDGNYNYNLEEILTDFEQAFKKSIDNNNVFRNKGSFKDSNANYNKYTYKLNKDTLNDIYSRLNDDSKKLLYDVYYFISDAEDVNDAKLLLESDINNWTDSLEFNIYTNGLLNEFKALEIGNNDSFINIEYSRDENDLVIRVPEYNVKVDVLASNNEITTTLYYKNTLLAREIKKLEDSKETIDVEISLMGANFTAKIIHNYTKDRTSVNGSYDATIDANFLFFDFNGTGNIEYNVSKNIDSGYIDVGKAIDINEFTKEDNEKLESTLNDFFKSRIGSNISDILGDGIDADDGIDDYFSLEA